jgi:excisionase family DNA binding protein
LESANLTRPPEEWREKDMTVKELALIRASENELPILQEMEESLSRKADSSFPAHSALPKFVGSDGRSFEIPPSLFQAFHQLVDYMAQRTAVSVVPYDEILNLQESADFLNISISSLLRLLERNILPFMEIGTHRYIRFSDLWEYKTRRSQERRKALAEIARISQEAGEY